MVANGSLAVGDELKLFDRFEPLELRGGAGVAITAVDTRTVTLLARFGAGVRDARYGGGRYIDDVSGDSVQLVRIANDKSYGAEARIEAGLRVGQQLQLQLSADAYVPRAQLTDEETLRPILNLSGTAAFALSPALALIYEASLAREAYEIKDLQFSDLLSLRVQHNLF